MTKKIVEMVCKSVNDHPMVFISVSLAVCVALACGNSLLVMETDQTKLWSHISESQQKDLELYTNIYGEDHVIISYITLLKEEREQEFDYSVIDKRILKELYELETTILNSTLSNGVNFDDVCLKTGRNNACTHFSVLYHWGFDLQEMLNDRVFKSTMGRTSVPHPIGISFAPDSVIGNYSIYLGRMQYASAYMSSILVKKTEYTDDILEQVNEHKIHHNENSNYTKVLLYSPQTVYEALNSELIKHAWPMVIGLFLMVGFVVLTLGKLSLANSKIGLGLFGILLVIFSMIVSTGITSILGIWFTPYNIQAIPLLVLSIGIDNIFVLSKVFQRFNCKESTEIALYHTLEVVGVSMIISTTFICLVFASIAVFVPIPAIRAIGIQLCLNLFVNFLMQVFCYVPAMVLDSKRSDANRVDIFCCFTAKNRPKKVHTPEFFDTLWSKFFELVLISKRRKALVISMFFIYLGFSIYSVTAVETNMSLSLLIPPDSEVGIYYSAYSRYWKSGIPLPIYYMFGDIDYPSHDTYLSLLDFKLQLDSQYGNKAIFWYSNFRSWLIFVSDHELVDDKIPEESFYPWLNEFLDGAGSPHVADLIFNENKTKLLYTRIYTIVPAVNLYSISQSYYYIEDLIQSDSLEFKVIPFSSTSFAFALFKYLHDMTIKSIIGCTVFVFLVQSFYVRNIVMVGIIVVVDTMLFLAIYSLHIVIGIDYNILSILGMVASIGVCSQYSIHFLRTFMNVKGPGDERVIESAEFLGLYSVCRRY
eukprot:TRINITY_DN6791_c0_g1_i2.p1 TRINITY_DN6791_c0_g1~~TRINITY_DN6791_c0_g1_i2.p1  ORF type:complete len:770 (-),score=74.31 TRINITY_DN6791_c0_g1_i2:312-2594(-)